MAGKGDQPDTNLPLNAPGQASLPPAEGSTADRKPTSAPTAPPTRVGPREILRLAIPAFLALVVEPLFLLADSAIIGHLGTPQLAGLGVAGSILTTAVGLFIFLAYGTTAVVARQLGAGHRAQATQAGLDALWLSALIGSLAGVALIAWAEPLCAAYGASPATLEHAVTYLRIAALAVPAMLVILALTGALRGVQDTKTPLVAAVCGFGANIVLNVALVYGMGWGVAGSAWGSVIAQTGMAIGLSLVVIRHARRTGASLRPHPLGVLRAARSGIPLLVRTLALRATLLLSVWVAAGLGEVPLASYQVSATVWTFLAFALDALAIAAQALTGHTLGAGDIDAARALTTLMARWGIVAGLILGGLIALTSPILPALFTTDPAVRAALALGLLVVGLAQPISGYAFLLDGVLIGAGDTRWLAWAQSALFVIYLPAAWAVHANGDALRAAGDGVALAALWLAFTGFMLARALLLRWRSQGRAWLVTGA